MNFFTILLIALSLSFDSFAASVCSGLSMCRKNRKLSHSLRIAFSLALFQGGMPVLGWYLGETFKTSVMSVDHWIAFILLAFLGIRMIKEGQYPINEKKIRNPTQWRVLLLMSIATSIDAFAIGIGFSFFVDSIWFPALLIGIVTFSVSMVGIYMGRKLGKKMAGIAEITGGIILILIGTEILIKHLFFS